jgi:hypothetical protein
MLQFIPPRLVSRPPMPLLPALSAIQIPVTAQTLHRRILVTNTYRQYRHDDTHNTSCLNLGPDYHCTQGHPSLYHSLRLAGSRREVLFVVDQAIGSVHATVSKGRSLQGLLPRFDAVARIRLDPKLGLQCHLPLRPRGGRSPLRPRRGSGAPLHVELFQLPIQYHSSVRKTEFADPMKEKR